MSLQILWLKETLESSAELVSQLSILASGDDELIGQTITNLAKTGDTRLEEFFELYRQGSVYNWPTEDGGIRIVVNLETVMDDDFNEFAPLIEPVTGKPFLINGIQAIARTCLIWKILVQGESCVL